MAEYVEFQAINKTAWVCGSCGNEFRSEFPICPHDKAYLIENKWIRYVDIEVFSQEWDQYRQIFSNHLNYAYAKSCVPKTKTDPNLVAFGMFIVTILVVLLIVIR